jgi:hypothetical protein
MCVGPAARRILRPCPAFPACPPWPCFAPHCCLPVERQAAEQAQRAADEQECRDLGFQPQTEAFGDCLLKLRELRAMERSGSGLGVGLGVGFGF